LSRCDDVAGFSLINASARARTLSPNAAPPFITCTLSTIRTQHRETERADNTHLNLVGHTRNVTTRICVLVVLVHVVHDYNFYLFIYDHQLHAAPPKLQSTEERTHSKVRRKERTRFKSRSSRQGANTSPSNRRGAPKHFRPATSPKTCLPDSNASMKRACRAALRAVMLPGSLSNTGSTPATHHPGTQNNLQPCLWRAAHEPATERSPAGRGCCRRFWP
jgi:hypothetical protein